MSEPKSASRLVFVRCLHATRGACVNTLCWLVWIALTISAGLMLFVRFQHEITVPDFVLRRLEKKLQVEQLRAEFGRTNLDLQGVLLLENVRLFGEGIADPLVEARAIRVEFSPWMLAIGHVDPHQIVIEGGRVNCPAPLSPSGVAQPVISELRLHADRHARSWSVITADWLVGSMRVHSTAEIDDSIVRPRHEAAQSSVLAQLLRGVRQAAAVLPELQRADEPRVELVVRELTAGHVDLRCDARVERIRAPGGVTAERVEFTTEYQTADWTQPVELPIRLSVAAVHGPEAVRVDDLQVNTRLRLPWMGEASWPRSVFLSAASIGPETDRSAFPRLRLDGEGAELGRRVAELIFGRSVFPADSGENLELAPMAAPIRFPLVRLERGESHSWHISTDLLLGGEPLGIAAEVDPDRAAAAVRIRARLAEPVLNGITTRVAAWRNSNFLSRLSFQSAVDLRALVQLDPGWHLAKAQASVYIAAATSSAIPLRETSAEITHRPGHLEVENLVLRQGESEVRGSYAQDLKTQDYRFLLRGHVFPTRINGWFSEWWPRLWRDFDFGGAHPLADVDVRGRWQSPHLSVVSGRLVAQPLTLRGVPLEYADVSFFVRPEHYDIVRFDARRGTQFAVGSFTRRDDSETHEPRRIDFDFESNLPLDEGAVFFGADGRATVEPYRFERAPDVSARGRIVWTDGVSREDISARVRSTGEFRFNGFPLRNARFAFTLLNNEITLQELTADLADGKLTGRATVTGPSTARRLWFAGMLAKADLAQTVKTWNEFRASTGDVAATAHSSSVASNLGTRGRLDLQVDATGPLDNLMALRGEGRASVVGAELGQVQMLGFLSRLLQGSIFGFTSLRFTNADAQFVIEERDLNFSKLTFTGPSSRLEGKGRYRMSDETVDFNVVLRPFRESDFALANLIGLVLEPIASVMRVRLTGTLEHPNWAFTAGSGNFPRQPGPAPTAAPGSVVLPGSPPIAPLFPAPAPVPSPVAPPSTTPGSSKTPKTD